MIKLNSLLTDKNKQRLTRGTIAVIFLVSMVLGVSFPRPAPPKVGLPGEVLDPQAIKDTQFRSVHVQHDLDVDGDADVDGTLNADAVDFDGDITLENDEIISNAIDNEISLTIGGTEEYSMTGSGFFFNANPLVLDADVDTSIAGSLDDYITVTLGAAGGQLAIATGNVKIGDGAETLALGGEDFYVEGTLESDGAANLGSTLAVGGDVTMENDEVLSNAVDDELSFTIGGAEEYSATATGLYLNGNNLYLDTDVNTYFDTAIDDEVSIYIGGAEEYSATATGFYLNGNNLYLDTDVNSYFNTAIDDEVSIWIGAAEEYSATATGLYLNGNNLYLDANVDTYFSNGIDDELSIYIGAAEEYSATATGLYLNGNDLVLDADVDTYISNSLDDYITVTIGAAGGQVAIAVGNVKIGDGVETLTLDGEDFYVEGTLEADGAADLGSTLSVGGDITFENDEVLSNAIDNELSFTIGGTEEYSATAAGFFFNGNNLVLDADVDTYFSTAIDDEVSVFIGGSEEYSLTATGLYLNGNDLVLDADVDTYLTNSLDDYITLTIGTAAGQLAVATGNVKIDDAAESLTLNGEDLFVEGTFEVDGSGRFDGGIALATGELVISNGFFLPDTGDLAITDGDWLTPTLQNVYNLDASGDVTFTLGMCGNDGQSLTLAADDGFRYAINTTNVKTADGNEIVFDQFDVVALLCMDTEWLLMLESNNQ